MVLYLGYFLFTSSLLNNIENYKTNFCNVNTDCSSGLCFNAGQTGQASFVPQQDSR